MQTFDEGTPHRYYTSLDADGEAALGRVALWSAWLEAYLSHLVSALLDSRLKFGQIVTSSMQASTLITLSRQLVEEHDLMSEDLKKRVRAILQAASDLLQKRNQVLHGAVGGSLFEGKVAFHGRRRGTTEHFSSDELDELSKSLYDIADAVFEIHGEVTDGNRDNWGFVNAMHYR